MGYAGQSRITALARYTPVASPTLWMVYAFTLLWTVKFTSELLQKKNHIWTACLRAGVYIPYTQHGSDSILSNGSLWLPRNQGVLFDWSIHKMTCHIEVHHAMARNSLLRQACNHRHQMPPSLHRWHGCHRQRDKRFYVLIKRTSITCVQWSSQRHPAQRLVLVVVRLQDQHAGIRMGLHV